MEENKRIFLEKLYQLHAKKLRDVAYMQLYYNREVARDLVQEVFLIAGLKVDTIYENENAYLWLQKTLKNLIKREKCKNIIGKNEDGSYIFAQEINIDDLSLEQIPIEETQFYEETIFEDLEKVLSKREMEFIKERYLEDKDHEEIAKKLNININASTSLGYRVKKKIKKILSQQK